MGVAHDLHVCIGKVILFLTDDDLRKTPVGIVSTIRDLNVKYSQNDTLILTYDMDPNGLSTIFFN